MIQYPGKALIKYLLSTLLALSFSNLSHAALDGQAIEIARQSLAYLAGKPRLSAGWFIVYDDSPEGDQARTTVWSGTSTLIRGVGFESVTTRGTEIRTHSYDGKQFTVEFGGEGLYAAVEFSGSFDQLVDELDTNHNYALPAAELFRKTDIERSLTDLDSAIYLGEVYFGGQAAHHLSFRGPGLDWQLWVSTDMSNPVPLMVVGTDVYSQGWPQYTAIFHDWVFDSRLLPTEILSPSLDGKQKIELLPLNNDVSDTQ